MYLNLSEARVRKYLTVLTSKPSVVRNVAS